MLANDTDPNGDVLNVSAVIQPTNGIVTIEPLTNVAVYQPNPAFTGMDVSTYTLSDGLGTASGSVNVTVEPKKIYLPLVFR